MTITFSEMMQLGTFIVALITLVHNLNKDKKSSRWISGKGQRPLQ